MLDRLGMPMVGVTFYGWVALTISTITTPIWGRLSDRLGDRTMLIAGWLGVFWQPLLFVFTTAETPKIFGWIPWPVLIDAVVCGIFWPGLVVSQNNLVIAEAPSERRAGLFAGLSSMAGVTGFTAAYMGGLVADLIGENNTIPIMSFEFDDMQFPLLIGAFLRLLTGFLILKIKDPPKRKSHITGSQAFGAVWRMLIGKPFRTGT